MKKVAILGSTGSIGTQTLDVVRNNADKLQVVSLVAYSNREKLAAQCKEFRPQYSALISIDGEECLTEAVKNADVAVVATRGTVALQCVLYCLKNGIAVALANKETLVCGGSLVMSEAKHATLLPVDSEHGAIAQCLLGRDCESVNKILLTASGGPFYHSDVDLHTVTPQQALKHPNWNMGSKITVDSATMMNKALEVIEAHWLFGVPTEKIQIVVHPQSVVHSMVQFDSGSVMAQLAVSDMRLPIATALLGQGCDKAVRCLDFSNAMSLTFETCDFERFPCAKWGYEIENYPPLCVSAMNAANDICVESFLQGNLAFDAFYSTIKRVVEHFATELSDVPVTVENIRKTDLMAKKYTQKIIDEVVC